MDGWMDASSVFASDSPTHRPTHLTQCCFTPAKIIIIERARRKREEEFEAKRLEKQRFKWPRDDQLSRLVLSEQQLNWLLGGYDVIGHKPLQYQAVSL
jgi:hypothetical protein